MTQKQENTISALSAVDGVLKKHEATWNVLPGFVNLVTQFRQERQLMAPDAERQQAGTDGTPIVKRSTRALVAGAATQIANNLHVWAVNNNNPVLADKMDFSDHELERQRDNVLPVTARGILHEAQAVSNDGVDQYGVTRDVIAALATMLDGYDDTSGSTRVATTGQVTATRNIAQHINKCGKILKLMAKMIGNFEKINPAFIAEFQGAKHVIDLGARHDDEDNNTPATPGK